jgi:hypothetical protein
MARVFSIPSYFHVFETRVSDYQNFNHQVISWELEKTKSISFVFAEISYKIEVREISLYHTEKL